MNIAEDYINWKEKILKFLFPRQKWIEGLAIFLLGLSIAFNYEEGKTTWLWNQYPFVAIIIAILVLFIAALWIRIERIKVDNRIKEISQDYAQNNPQESVQNLTNRQLEVLNLIGKGKSNKEIMNELFIEQSTLKTHINSIYKTLEIKNRKQAREIARSIKT